MKITSASKKVLASALSAAMVVAFAPTVAFAGSATSQQPTSVASVTSADGKSVIYYETLAEAFTAAAAGDTVALLADIEKDTAAQVNTLGDVATNGVKGGVIVIGGGHTVTTEDATLTISVAGGTAKAQTSVTDVTFKSSHKTAGVADGAVTLTLDKTTQDADVDDYVNLSGVTADNIEVTDNSAKTTYATIAGTTVTDTLTTAEVTAVKSGAYGVVEADGKTAIADGTYKSVVANANVELAIAGGTFTGGMDENQQYLYALDVKSGATSVAVKGGTFTGFIANANDVWEEDASSTVKIYTCTAGKKPYIYTDGADTEYVAATILNDQYASANDGSAIGANKYAVAVPADGSVITDGNSSTTPLTGDDAFKYLGTIGKVTLTGGTFSSDPLKIGKLGTNVVCTQSDDKATWTVGSGVDAKAGAAINMAANGKLAIGETPATKAIAAAASAWLAEVKDLKLPADLALAKKDAINYYTLAELYTDVSDNGAVATLSTAARTSYEDVKGVTAASSKELQDTKAEYDAIEAAATAAKLTAVVDQRAADLAANKTLKAYTQFYGISADLNGMAEASTLGAGNEVTFYVATGDITDYSDNNAYSIVYADGTVVAGEKIVVNASNKKALDVAEGTYVAFKTAKMGTFAIAYTDTFADTKAELEELQKQLDELKKQQDADKATIVALQDQIAAASAAGKSKTVKLGAKKTKTASAKSVTLKAVASESGAKMTFKKASGSAKITVAESGKATLKKGVKRGTYKATVTATVGASSKNVTVKFVIK